MTDIASSAIAARENAREVSGQFGAQDHSAPELTLTDPKQKVVDEILTKRFGHIMPGGLAAGDGLDLDEVADLMLEAIAQHQVANPSVVVIDGEGKANDSAGVEVIDLDYLGEWYDDGGSSEEHAERATDDLDRLRAAGLDETSAAHKLREYIGEELASDIASDWYDDEKHVIGGRYGDYIIDEGFPNSETVKIRDVNTGETMATFATFAAAKAAIDEKLAG